MQLYTHDQESPLQIWVITHDLNSYPICETVSVVNGVRKKVQPVKVVYHNPNMVSIVWSEPQSGTAILVG